MFSGRTFAQALSKWTYGPVKKGKKSLDDLLRAIVTIKSQAMCGTGMIGAYHEQHVLPLMASKLRKFEMVTDVDLRGTTMSLDSISNSKVEQRLIEALR